VTPQAARSGGTGSAVLIAAVALFFAAMGIQALGWPESILANFGVATLPADARNEVRAVYGGYGVAIALLLGFSLVSRESGQALLLAVAVSVLGMAGGRVYSFAIESAEGSTPLLFLGVELALAAALLVARRLRCG
jgi:hypothetical protein